MVTTGAIGRAKLQSNHHHQKTNTKSFLQAGCPSCHPTNSVKALKGKYLPSMMWKTNDHAHCTWWQGILARRVPQTTCKPRRPCCHPLSAPSPCPAWSPAPSPCCRPASSRTWTQSLSHHHISSINCSSSSCGLSSSYSVGFTSKKASSWNFHPLPAATF